MIWDIFYLVNKKFFLIPIRFIKVNLKLKFIKFLLLYILKSYQLNLKTVIFFLCVHMASNRSQHYIISELSYLALNFALHFRHNGNNWTSLRYK